LKLKDHRLKPVVSGRTGTERCRLKLKDHRLKPVVSGRTDTERCRLKLKDHRLKPVVSGVRSQALTASLRTNGPV
jgi:hypothetical protein